MNISGSAIPVPTPCISRPRSSSAKTGADAHITVPMIKSVIAVTKRRLVVKRLLSHEDAGMIMESISRYPVVIHCTVDVPTPNSFMSDGNVTFMAVSTTTPENDMSPVATIDIISLASILLSNCVFVFILSIPFCFIYLIAEFLHYAALRYREKPRS